MIRCQGHFLIGESKQSYEKQFPQQLTIEQDCQENHGTDRARLLLQEEAEQVEALEHGVAQLQNGVKGLGDEEEG